MICPGCGTQNEADAQFCNECGAALQAGCSNCGATNKPGAKFCSKCGTALAGADMTAGRTTGLTATAAAKPAGGAERRLVTVLFADLVGFTPFAEERDAEDVRDTLSRYFDLCSDIVGRYGGTCRPPTRTTPSAPSERPWSSLTQLLRSGRAYRRARGCSPARRRSPSARRTRAWSPAIWSTPPVGFNQSHRRAAFWSGRAPIAPQTTRSRSKKQAIRRSRASRHRSLRGGLCALWPSAAGATAARGWKRRLSAVVTSCAY